MKNTKMYNFSWSELAFGSKKPLKDLNAIFIAAPRDISDKRILEIIKTYLPKANLIFGLSNEEYVVGLEGQPQFKMLPAARLSSLVEKIAKSSSKHKVYSLEYSQRDLPFILEKLKPQKAVFINGSWYQAFHHKKEYYALQDKNISSEFISPFSSEDEAKEYAKKTKLIAPVPAPTMSDTEAMRYSLELAKKSYDFGGYQTALVIGKKSGGKYKYVLGAHNKVEPYETYSMHHGALREINHSPANDLNFYDTVHAEMLAVVTAQKENVSFKGATIFINLMPCPTCTRALIETDLAELIYSVDHSDGYAVKMFEAVGKKVRRLVL